MIMPAPNSNSSGDTAASLKRVTWVNSGWI